MISSEHVLADVINRYFVTPKTDHTSPPCTFITNSSKENNIPVLISVHQHQLKHFVVDIFSTSTIRLALDIKRSPLPLVDIVTPPSQIFLVDVTAEFVAILSVVTAFPAQSICIHSSIWQTSN